MEGSGRVIKVRVAYDGAAFHGWEKQPGLVTVQGSLEDAVRRVTGETVPIFGSGRTDAGVSAVGQTAHFRIDSDLSADDIPNALNAQLPKTLVVRDAQEMGPGFHARFSATGKRYLYQIVTGKWRPPMVGSGIHFVRGTLDATAMAQAARHFEGEHDFSSVASLLDGDKRRPVRRMTVCRVEESAAQFGVPVGDPSLIKLSIVMDAKGFLYKMARGIVGTLMEVGWGKRDPETIPALLEARDRSCGGPTAPAEGLTLVEVFY